MVTCLRGLYASITAVSAEELQRRKRTGVGEKHRVVDLFKREKAWEKNSRFGRRPRNGLTAAFLMRL
jgi:hypothetical protein